MKFRGLTSRGVKPRPPSSGAIIAPRGHSKSQFDRIMAEAREQKPAATPDPALKGVKGGNCNITACQSPGAHFRNKVMDRYYCHYCATDMHRFALRRGEETLFPNYDAELEEFRTKRLAIMADLIESAA